MKRNYVNVKGKGEKKTVSVCMTIKASSQSFVWQKVGEVRMWDEQESLRSDCGGKSW